MNRTTPVIPAEDIQRQREYCAELRALNARLPAPPKAWVDTYGRQHSPEQLGVGLVLLAAVGVHPGLGGRGDRKSTRLNSSHWS